MTSYVAYARRSSDREDHQVLSIGEQLEALRDLAAKRGLDVTEELVEHASAKDPGRPVFGDLIKKIRAGKVGGILVWKLDRLARNMVDAGEIIFQLTRGKLKEIITPETAYNGSGDAKFMLAMLFGAASKYSDDLSANVRRGNLEVLRRGKVPGPVPIGYLKTHEHELVAGSGTVIPDPERFQIVKSVWQEVLKGEKNLSEVWRKARYDWGLTTRPTKNTLARPIALTNIYALLRNPFYAGKIAREGQLFKGEHAPMITWAQFERVQQILAKREHAAPNREHDFLYHGVVQCGDCGRGLTGEEHVKPSGRRYIYYRCSRRRMGYVRCKAPAIKEDDITRKLEELFDSVTIDPQIREWAFDAVAWWTGENDVTPEKLLRRAKSALRAAEYQLAVLTDMAMKGSITQAEYLVKRTNQLAKIEHCREALSEPAEKLAAWRLLRDEKQRNGLGLGRDFRKADQTTKRKIVVRTIANIIVSGRKPMVELRAPFVIRGTNMNLQDGRAQTHVGTQTGCERKLGSMKNKITDTTV